MKNTFIERFVDRHYAGQLAVKVQDNQVVVTKTGDTDPLFYFQLPVGSPEKQAKEVSEKINAWFGPDDTTLATARKLRSQRIERVGKIIAAISRCLANDNYFYLTGGIKATLISSALCAVFYTYSWAVSTATIDAKSYLENLASKNK